MSESVGSIYYTVDAETRGLLDAERQVDRSTRNMERGFDRTDGSVNRLSDSLGNLKNIVTAVAGAMAVNQVIQYADAWTNAQNRIRVVTESQEELEHVTQRLMAVANESRASIGATTDLYSKLWRATRSLGTSQQDVIQLTDTINKGFAASGASTQEAEGAIRQLAQGLQAGALRGEEYNSVSESAETIMRALAEETGKTKDELRDFAAEGGITAELLVKSVQNFSDVINEEFRATMETFATNWQEASNNITQFIGESGAVTTVVKETGEAIVILSENIDDIASVAMIASTAIGVRLVQALGAAIAKKAGAALSAATLSRAYSMMGARATAAAVAVRGLRGAVALLGGPMGVAIVATMALGELGRQFDQSEEKAREYASAVDEAAESTKKFSETSLKMQIAAITVEMAKAEAAAQSLDETNRKMMSGNGIFGGMDSSDVVDQAQQIADTGGKASDTVSQLSAQLEGLKKALDIVQGDSSSDSDDDDDDEESDAVKKARKRFESLKKQLETERETIEREYRERNALIRRFTEEGSQEQVRLLERSSKKRREALKGISEEYQGLIDELYPVRAAQRKFREEMERLELAHQIGMIDDLSDAQKRLRESMRSDENWQDAYGFSPDDTKQLDKANDAARELGMTFSSAFEDAIVEGEGLREVLQGIAEDIQRLMIRKSITEPAADALGSVDWGGMVGNFAGSLFGSGGASVNTSGVQAMGFNTGSFADGGYTGAGGKHDIAGVVHRGEYVMPKDVVEQPGMLSALEQLKNTRGYLKGGLVGGGSTSPGPGGSSLDVHIHNEGGDPMQVSRSEQRRGGGGQRELHLWVNRMVDQRMKQNFQDGTMDRQMGRLYGVRRG